MKTFLANDELGTTSEESVGFIFWGRSESGSQDGVDHVLHGIGFSRVGVGVDVGVDVAVF